jgi:hypothetical protein
MVARSVSKRNRPTECVHLSDQSGPGDTGREHVGFIDDHLTTYRQRAGKPELAIDSGPTTPASLVA